MERVLEDGEVEQRRGTGENRIKIRISVLSFSVGQKPFERNLLIY